MKELLIELAQGQARIEEKLDNAIKAQDKHHLEDHEKFESQGKRIGSLEQSRSWVYGAAAAIGGFVTLFADKVIAKVFP